MSRSGAGDPYTGDDVRSGRDLSSLIPDSLSDIGAGWLTALKGNVGTLVDFAKAPRKFVIGILLTWLVGNILGFTQAVVALVLDGFGLAAQGAAMPFVTASNSWAAAGNALLSWGATVGSGIIGFFVSLGWLAPIVAALLFVLVLEVGETVSVPAASAFSDLLGAIPVVGSILDAGLTFVIGVARRIAGGSS